MFKYSNPKYHLDIVYPNKMYGGLYSLGPLIVYNIVNQRKEWHCQRVFLDQGKITAPLVGFTLQYELDLKNILKMKPKEALTFVGGPVANSNIELVAPHFDFIFLGDIEGPLPKVLEEYEKGKDGFLDRIAKIEGVYVPGKNKPTYYINQNLDDVPYPLVQPFPEKINEDFVFGKAFMLEVERSCPYRCNFCAIPTFYQKPKFRSLEKLKEIIDQGIIINQPEKVVLYAPSFVHPKRLELLQYLQTKNIRVVVPSIKAEHMTKDILQVIKELGQESITIAPVAGQALRFKMNKPVKDQAFFQLVKRCNEVGLKKLKMYMMVGVPDTTNKDLEEFVTFVKKVVSLFKGKTYLSINYFVPKPKTPWANHKFDKKTCKEQAKIIQKALPKLKIKMPKISTSLLEWNISRGERI